MKPKTIQQTEQALRELYASYGYRLFTVRYFEPYDLYVRYKNFLTFKQVLTFTDTDGTLMALKPDITLSVARSVPAGDVLSKVYYTENVCRVPENETGFREIRQAGLECLGPVGPLEEAETVLLASESLSCISPDSLLDVSDMGILKGILNAIRQLPQIPQDEMPQVREKLLQDLSSRNAPAVEALCRQYHFPGDLTDLLKNLTKLYGPLPAVLEKAEALKFPPESRKALDHLKTLSDTLTKIGLTRINLDFSLWEDPEYYNGLVMRGYVATVPSMVLSGGRYDPLLKSLGKSGGAIGFAVYLNTLEDFCEEAEETVPDEILTYTSSDEAAPLLLKARNLTRAGRKVLLMRNSLPSGKGETS